MMCMCLCMFAKMPADRMTSVVERIRISNEQWNECGGHRGFAAAANVRMGKVCPSTTGKALDRLVVNTHRLELILMHWISLSRTLERKKGFRVNQKLNRLLLIALTSHEEVASLSFFSVIIARQLPGFPPLPPHFDTLLWNSKSITTATVIRQMWTFPRTVLC